MAHGTATGAVSTGMSARGVGVSPGLSSDGYQTSGERVCIALGGLGATGIVAARGDAPASGVRQRLRIAASIEANGVTRGTWPE